MVTILLFRTKYIKNNIIDKAKLWNYIKMLYVELITCTFLNIRLVFKGSVGL